MRITPTLTNTLKTIIVRIGGGMIITLTTLTDTLKSRIVAFEPKIKETYFIKSLFILFISSRFFLV